MPRLHSLSNVERHCLDGVENRASNRDFNNVYESSGMSEGKRSEMRGRTDVFLTVKLARLDISVTHWTPLRRRIKPHMP